MTEADGWKNEFEILKLFAFLLFTGRNGGTLKRKSHLCIPFLGIARPQPQFPH
jgi:hypothetical protein